jgi:hypothetical protein
LRRKGEEDEGRETDVGVPLVSGKEEKRKRHWVSWAAQVKRLMG